MPAGGLVPTTFEWLLCRAGRTLFGLPVNQLAEVMRPLPIEHISGMPPILLGLSIIRGLPVPVISAAQLLSNSDTNAERLVTMMIGGRTIALAVGEVIGIRPIAPELLGTSSRLLQNAAPDAVEAIAALDGELLLLLHAARIVPQSLLDEISAREASESSR
jgi:purine-binding chemotaxis protein CheW